MNLLHPDIFYEHNREWQKHRLEEGQRVRLFIQPTSTQTHLKDQLFLASGEFFIAFGNRLKSRAAQPICKPQAV